MEASLARIVAAVEALTTAGAGRPADSLTPGELVAVNEAYGLLKRQVDAGIASVAAEIARQSRVELGRDSLAKKQGFRSPAAMVSTATGASLGEATRMLQVGEATAPRLSLGGEPRPSRHPHVGAAIEAGSLGMSAASAIITLLDRLSMRVDAAALDAAESELVHLAAGLRPDEIGKLIARAEARLDPDSVARRDDEARAGRYLIVRERDGVIALDGRLDIESGAPVLAAISGFVTQIFRRNEHAPDADRDPRSVKQLQADALSELCRHTLACDEAPTGPTTTVIVRVNLADLQSGTGTAEFDGIDQPVPTSTIRRLAADLQIIPAVLGGDSEILDWGRAKRLFTPPQRLALAERDGGCAFCGAPPNQCIAHHLRWWERDTGPTDLDNGILLCTGCHHRIHDDGWNIEIEGTGTHARVWFIPPPWIDPARTPRLGGRARYTLSA